MCGAIHKRARCAVSQLLKSDRQNSLFTSQFSEVEGRVEADRQRFFWRAMNAVLPWKSAFISGKQLFFNQPGTYPQVIQSIINSMAQNAVESRAARTIREIFASGRPLTYIQ